MFAGCRVELISILSNSLKEIVNILGGFKSKSKTENLLRTTDLMKPINWL
jgi:hypothetical protein